MDKFSSESSEQLADALSMVEQEVSRFAARLPAHAYDRADLLGYAWLGLCEARVRFRPEQGTSLSAFARLRVRGALVDAMRQSYGLVRRRYLERLVRDGILDGENTSLRKYVESRKRDATLERYDTLYNQTPEEALQQAQMVALRRQHQMERAHSEQQQARRSGRRVVRRMLNAKLGAAWRSWRWSRRWRS